MEEKMIYFVWDVFYVNPEKISDAENAKEIIEQYSGSSKIPIRILELGNRYESRFIVVAGEGALYPWKSGQRVMVGLVCGLIWQLKYLRELRIRGIDNSVYQDFYLYDSIKPIEFGKTIPDDDTKAFNGIATFELYTCLAKIAEENSSLMGNRCFYE